MNPYAVVQQFEQELCAYTGARYAVTTSSCSSALMLACAWVYKQSSFEGLYKWPTVTLPQNTYASAAMSAIHAGFHVQFEPIQWQGEYQLNPLPIWDSARRFRRAMFRGDCFQCVSFQTSKILGLEQGGAVLHDNEEADTWLRRARFDGRLDHTEKLPKQIGYHCYLNPSTAAQGIARLACLPDNPPDNGGSYLFEDLSKLDIWR